MPVTRLLDLEKLIADYRLAESRIAAPKTFNGTADLEPGYDFPVLPAGDADHPGKIVPRGFLQLIAGTQDGVKAFGSGRLEIANLIASPVKSTDCPCHGQPDLAPCVRTRHCPHG